MTDATQPLLEIEHLSIAAGEGEVARELVSDVSLTLRAGERLGLIGESGSGKSLTSLSITSLLPQGLHASGSIRLAGAETIGASEAALKPLRGPAAGIVFQEPLTALDPLMRVGRQIAEPIRRHRSLAGAALQQAVTEALAEVLLDDPRLARSFPHELSGGQRQRVAIAIALAARPKLLIADEPTTALDVTVQAEVLGLLDRLVTERNMALLFVSHDLAVVSRMTDRVLVLQNGSVVESGPVAEIIGSPQHPYTAQLIAHARALDGALDGSSGAGSVADSGTGSGTASLESNGGAA